MMAIEMAIEMAIDGHLDGIGRGNQWAMMAIMMAIKMAIDGRAKICSLQSMQVVLEGQYPDILTYGLYLPLEDYPSVLQGMDDGLCEIGIISEDSWQDLSPLNNHCLTKALLQETVTTTPVALPLGRRLTRPRHRACTTRCAQDRR